MSHTSASAFATNLAEGLWQFVYGTVNIVSDLYEPQTMPAAPRDATTHDGNGLLCAFDPYPTPAAAGTTYATVAALASAIGAVGAGGYLCVGNLTDTGTDLTIPPGDYGGAVVEAKNLYGVNVKNIFFHDVRNLVMRGFKGLIFQGGGNDPVSGLTQTGTEGVWIDHCYGTRFRLAAKTRGTGRVRVSNWQTPDDGTAGYHSISWFLEGILFKAAIGKAGTANYTDRLHPNRIDRFIADRVYIGPFGGLSPSSAHGDLIQPIYSGSGGYFGGYIINSAAIEQVPGPTLLTVNGAFFADGNTKFKDFWVNNFLGRDTIVHSIAIDTAISNTAIENSFGQALVIFKAPTRANAAYAENNVKGSAGPVMGSTAGTEINTVSISDLGISTTAIFPQYNTYPLSWRAFANPAVGYTTAGPGVFVASLEAKRVALGI